MSAHLYAPHTRKVIRPPAQTLPPSPDLPGMSSGGQALDRRTQAQMSARFGHDFSSVRIHTDTRAEESAAALGANAFATGTDIVFGAGKYLPGSSDTQRLLAHELTHVVQQAQSGPGDPSRVSRRGDSSEREADTLAMDVTGGRAVEVQAAPCAAIARDPNDDQQRQMAMMQNPLLAGAFGMMGMPGSAPAAKPDADWTDFTDFTHNPIWTVGTNDAVSGSVGIAQKRLEDLHKAEAGRSIARADEMESEFGLRDFQENRDWSPSSGTPEEIAGQKNLWQAGADLEDAENVARGGNSALRVEQTVENTASRFSPALKTAGTVGKFLSPFGVWSDANSLVDDWQKGEHADAVADGLGLTSSAIGTLDLLGTGATMVGATGAGTALSGFAAAANPVGAVAGSAAGGYAFGGFLRNTSNDYAKKHELYGKGEDGEARNGTEAAADAGIAVKDAVSDFDIGGYQLPGQKYLGDIAGGVTSIVGSWDTAAYSGIHAAGSGIAHGAGWLKDRIFGEDVEVDMAGVNKMQQDLGQTMDTRDMDEQRAELYGDHNQVAHEEMPPLPVKGR